MRSQGAQPAARRFDHLYDFGDGWEHQVVQLGAGGTRPGVVAGHGPCPPDDVGGPPGYDELRQAVADPRHPDHDRMRRWAGEWTDDFDRAAADLLLQ